MSDSPSPLYKRLPHGPHRLTQKQVVTHQVTRILGAMIEAVAIYGYSGASVKKIVALAGVSRRSFYEQFSNKEDCFLQCCEYVYGQLSSAVEDACEGSHGAPEELFQDGLSALAQQVEQNPQRLRMLLTAVPVLGPGGLLQMHKMIAKCQRAIISGFGWPTETAIRRTPVVRGVVGGLQRMMLLRLCGESSAQSQSLTQEMLKWTMLLQSPAADRLPEPIVVPEHRSMVAPNTLVQTDRERLGRAVLELVEAYGYTEGVIPDRIIDRAGLTVDSFFAHFNNGHECFASALEDVREGLLRVAGDPGLMSGDWAQTVPRVMRALMDHLADDPLYTRAITMSVFLGGPWAVRYSDGLASDLASQLIYGAPTETSITLVKDGIEGALWHTISAFAVTDRIASLPGVASHLSYLMLAAFLGGETAMRTIEQEQRSREDR